MTANTHEAALRQQIDQLAQLRAAIGQAIVGQDAVVEQLLIGLLAAGHCLLEGVPGLGKTLLVRSLGQALALRFRRVQFTPDLMPSEILGTELLEEDHGTGRRAFRFQQGPVFTNLLLADELNRTPPKTQAALLEAMGERTVSYAGVTHALPAPFFVLATQNPLEQAGTYPLPEAQLDRFLLHIRVDYPDEAEERAILEQTTGRGSGSVSAVMSGEELLALGALLAGTAELLVMGPADAGLAERLTSATERGELDWRGFVPNREALPLIEGAIAGLSLLHDVPNYRHSLPTKLAEYGAHGVPIITTPNPSSVDFVEHSGAGVVVPFADVEAVAEVISRLIEHPEEAATLAAAGRETASTLFNWAIASETFRSAVAGR